MTDEGTRSVLEQLKGTPLCGVTLTLMSYYLGISLQRLCRGASIANPVLVAILFIGGVLRLTRTSYHAYFAGAQPIAFLLGPATVALAVPIIHNLKHLRGMWIAICLAVTAGSLVAAVSGIGLVDLFGGNREVAMSMAPKAATTPIAIAVSQSLDGIPSLTAVLAITSGIFAAVSLKFLLGLIKIKGWRPLGLAAGTAGSGIGAAHALSLHGTAGAFAGVAVALNGLITSLLVPLLVHFWPK